MNYRRFAISAWAAIAGFGLAVYGADQAGLRFNTTPSLPRGLWRVSTAPDHLAAGTIVNICPPPGRAADTARERGYIATGSCPGNYEPLIKPIAAVAGDTVDLTPAGVLINGRPIPASPVLAIDTAGRPLPAAPAHLVVPAGHVWLMSTYNSHSFDSRYFGPVPTALVRGVAVALLTEAGE